MNIEMLGSNLKGQMKPIAQLQRDLEGDNKIAHAYLFVGPPGLGKQTLALEFAHVLLGSAMNNHPDLMIVEKQVINIRIAEIRNLQDWLAYKPYMAERRVAIVPEAHLMSNEAANAFLKTLEEPAGHSVVILAADMESLPATVVSRCRVIRFMPLPWEEAAEILIEHGIDDDPARQLAVVSGGSPGRALSFAQLDIKSLLANTAHLLEGLIGGDNVAALEMAEALEKDPLRRDAVLSALDIYCRDALFYINGIKSRILLLQDDLTGQLTGLTTDGLRRVMGLVAETRRRLARNANPLISLVDLFLQIGKVAKEVV